MHCHQLRHSTVQGHGSGQSVFSLLLAHHRAADINTAEEVHLIEMHSNAASQGEPVQGRALPCSGWKADAEKQLCGALAGIQFQGSSSAERAHVLLLALIESALPCSIFACQSSSCPQPLQQSLHSKWRVSKRCSAQKHELDTGASSL